MPAPAAPPCSGCLGDLFEHIGITVDDLPRSIAQFDPVMQALGCTRQDADNSVAWSLGEDELILFPAREPGTGPHRHGKVGWQHLAFPVDSRAEVDRLHQIATDTGWTAVRGPKLFPRFNDRYNPAFVEDDTVIRLEFMRNPPRESALID
ncbi:hypothetical protein AVP42_00603 [Agromyces sp. NDB4Y10]|uniref:VOC family protein n=1 Tax=Agromyces sp. NDB4Y10 TaxID=1775951 RepID=UPI0007B1F3F1|nr:VOC family protein [Agromyces sp. NDB4Y10]KZE94676.1 hypothetical protein AVP42_00603 [Agromyces sp. NDB4Y10]